MCKDTLKDEEIIFGTTFNDGHFSELLPRNPNAAEMETLWKLHPGIFGHDSCEGCGHTSFAYAQVMKEDPDRPGWTGYNEMKFYCPNCHKRTGYGTNPHRSAAILKEIRTLLKG